MAGERKTDPGDGIALPLGDRYRLGRVVGRGGMGVVYEAWDAALEETVALKTLLALDRDALLLFKREFRALADLRHPNLVSLGELVSDGTAWFFTMELLKGEDFRRYVRGASQSPVTHADTGTPTARAIQATPTVHDSVPHSPRPISPAPAQAHGVDLARLRSAIAGLAEGLAVVHAAGRAHLDVKPSNVRLTHDGRAVLLDFGLAGAAALAASKPGTVMGTPEYMAPEQSLGVSGPSCDLYALGVMLYEALSGELPFDGPSVALLAAKARKDPVPVALLAPSSPADLATLAMELLARDPSLRPSAREVSARARGEDDAPREAAMRAPFVGRAQDLAMLEAALAEVTAGQVTVVTIEGEAGLGKSTLAAEFARRAVLASRARALFGRCYEQESVPYKAFDAIVDELSLLLSADPARAARLAPAIASAARVFPVLAGAEAAAARGGDDVEARRLAFVGLCAVLADFARERSLIVILDDVQWGDEDSAHLTAELLDSPDAPAMMIVATHRPVATPNALLAALRSTRGSSRLHVQLAPLAVADACLAAVLLGASPTAASAIARSSSGNPLLLGELAWHVAHGGSVDGDASVVTVEGALLARVRALSPASQRLLEMIAIAGRPTRESVLARAAEIDADVREAVDALLLAALVRRGGVRGPDALEASHDRVRETVAASLDVTTRKRLHRALAETLKTAPHPEPEALAEHLSHAGEFRAAAVWARRAAELCEAALAFGRAARFYELALADPDLEPRERRRLLAKRGLSLASAGRGREAAEQFLRAAEGAPATESLAYRQRASEQFLIAGHTVDGKRVLDQVLRDVGIFAPKSLATSLPMLLVEGARLSARGLSATFRAEADVPERDLVRVDACLAAARALSIIDTMQGSYFQVRQLRLALDAGEPLRILYGLALSAGFLAAGESTRGTAARERLAIAEARAVGVANPRGEAFVDMARAVIAYCRGEWAETARWGREGASVLETRCTDATWDLNVSRVFIALGLGFSGDLVSLDRDVRGWMRDAHSRQDLYLASHLRLISTPWLSLARGDMRAAATDLDRALAEWPHEGFSWATYFEQFHRTLFALYEGDLEAAERAIASHAKWPCSLYLSQFVMHRLLTEWTRGAVAAARFRQSGSSAERRSVTKSVRAMRKVDEPWARGLASALDAASVRQANEAEAMALLERAERELTMAGMGLFAEAAAHERARLRGDDAGVRAARAGMERRGVVEATKVARTLVPGV